MLKSLPAPVTGAAPGGPLAAQQPALPAAATPAAAADRAGSPLLQWSPSFNDLRQAAAPAHSPADVASAPGPAQSSPLQASTPLPEVALLSGLLLFLCALLLRRFARPQRRPLLIGARLPTLGSVARQPASANTANTAPRHQHSDTPCGLQAT